MKLKALNLLVALYVTGCGAADDKAAPAPAAQRSPVAEQVPATVSETTPPPVLRTSFAVDDVTALPACDKASEGFLAYVKADKTIEACSDGEWSVIDLRAPQEDQGAAAPAAVAAEAVQADPVPSMNQWLDPVTKRLWTKGAGEVAFDYAKTVCEGDWRLPTEAELTLALARGMADYSSGDLRIVWADSGRAIKNTDAVHPISPSKATAYCVSAK